MLYQTKTYHSPLNITTARILMNEYGRLHIPFFFAIDFEMERPIILRPDEITSDEIRFDINGKKNYELFDMDLPASKFKKYPLSLAQYKAGFDLVQQEINAGNTYLLNLTYPTQIETNLSLEDIFKQSPAPYKLWLKDQLVLFSPETFVRIDDQKIASFPMKGTIDAAIPNATEVILKDKKEKAEHCTIVDLIRNDLNRVAENVRVERFRYLDKIVTNEKTLWQVSSKIVGDLPDDYEQQLGDILFKLLPAGSISGAPKCKTIEIIQAAELGKRGYYTGVFGYFDGKNLDSGVMIRLIEQKDGQLFYKSGGGITTFSQMEKEYQELIDKVYLPCDAL